METDIEVCVQGLISPFLVPPPPPSFVWLCAEGPVSFCLCPSRLVSACIITLFQIKLVALIVMGKAFRNFVNTKSLVYTP